MGIQNMGTAPARNQASAVGKPSKVSTPTIGEIASAASMGKTPITKGPGKTGFDGGVMAGKIKI